MERRDFLKYLGTLAAAGVITGCGRKIEDGGAALNSANLCASPLSNSSVSALIVPSQKLVLPATGAAASASASKPTVLSAVSRRTAPKGGIGGTTANAKGVSAVSRAYWKAVSAQSTRMTRMGAFSRITVHHEGNATPNYDANPAAVACSLRRIQSAHCKTMQAGDIGYHFIIDRQGLIWQGRELCYQGAHVKSNNSNNIGIMCLGNFEIQQPTQAQVNTLARLCQALMQGYHIPPAKLYAHRELRSTACPGRNLYPQVVNIRSRIRIV